MSREENEQAILRLLENKEYNIAGLASVLNLNYYTVRERVNDLLVRQLIIVSRVENRSRLYRVNPAQVPEEYIPYITSLISRQRHKSVLLLEQVGQEDQMQSVAACRDIPRLMTHLMDLANTASHNLDVSHELAETRVQMQRHFLTLKNAAAIYEQILQDPRFWNPKDLKKMVHDVDYIPQEINKAVEYYKEKSA